MKLSNAAEAGYNALHISRGHVNRGNMPLVPWDELDVVTKKAWIAAVTAVLFTCAAEVEIDG